MGEGDLTADEAKRRQREQAKNMNPIDQAIASVGALVGTYGQAAQDLLGVGRQAGNVVNDIGAAAEGDPKKLSKNRK